MRRMGDKSRHIQEDSVTGNSKTTSFPVSFLYAAENVSTLYSVLFLSFGSKNTCKEDLLHYLRQLNGH